MTSLRKLGRTEALVLLIAATTSSCVGPRPGDAAARGEDEMIVAGQRFHTTAPVVLWTDRGGYDAYRVEPRFPSEQKADTPAAEETPRYGSLRRNLPAEVVERGIADAITLDVLQESVDQFVLHYDVCGTSRRCFQVLQDQRGLSVHFMLDVDGTLYQTLDLKERAWHAGEANDRSVGVEIAQIGAYPAEDVDTLARWYSHDDDGPKVVFPMAVTGIRTPDFEARPSRKEPIVGVIQGQTLRQFDFTDEQYESLARLLASVHRVLPKIRLDAPRDPTGAVLNRALTEAELAAFSGVLGHYHVTSRKIDPGPAFDWERVLVRARALAGSDETSTMAEAPRS